MASSRKRTPKTHEQVTNEMVGAVKRQVRSLETRATAEDPWLMAEMFGMAQEMEAAAVRVMASLRSQGYRWEDIAVSMSAEHGPRVSAQTMIKRYAKRVAAHQAEQS